jgi:cell division protein FtsL
MTLSQSFTNEQKDKEFKIQTISLIAHENMCNRFEKLIHKLYIIILILIAVIVSVIGSIIYTINQYSLIQEDKDVSINSDLSDNNGSNVVLGGNYYGQSEDTKKN